MKNQATFLLLLLSIPAMIQAQKAPDSPSKFKQTIYINLGSVIFDSQVSISFERSIYRSSTNFETRVKLNAGRYLVNGSDYEADAPITSSYYGLSLQQLIPVGKTYIELNAGAAQTRYSTLSDPSDRNKIRAYTLAGLRYSNNGWLARVGIGNLELLHIGLGLEF
ncbi:MAG: hypothetical protein KTR30_19415 [Saprospiraceae bacterium]|nr:hypothetical protein [Saprospiraceae bacterium]